jgi:cyclic beta-1,2-glucan synthetase
MGVTIRFFLCAGKNVIVYIDGRETEMPALAAGASCSDLTICMKDGTLGGPDAVKVPGAREFDTANTRGPHIAVLGQVPFTTLLTNAGAGQTRFGAMAVTRWRADPTLDDSGHWCYVRDLTTGRTWSTGFQPTCIDPLWYKVRFEEDCVSFQRRDGDIETITAIVVSSRDAIEIRRVTLTNLASEERDVELTSCAEIVAAPFHIDRSHPAFSNLFVQTEWIAGSNTLLAMRRPRSQENEPVWCGQTLCVIDGAGAKPSCESDRAKFIGRGRSYRNPVAMGKPGDLSGSSGAVLDPVFALRTIVTIPPGGSASVAFVTFMAVDRKHALGAAAAFNNPDVVIRSMQSARTQTTDERGQLYQALAGHLLFPRRLSGRTFAGRDELEYLGISGDLPIMLATIETPEGIEGLTELLKIHRYWRARGIRSDLMIIASYSSETLENMLDAFKSEPMALHDAELFTHPGSVVVEDMSSLSEMQIDSLRAASRFEVACDGFDVKRYLDSLESAL